MRPNGQPGPGRGQGEGRGGGDAGRGRGQQEERRGAEEQEVPDDESELLGGGRGRQGDRPPQMDAGLAKCCPDATDLSHATYRNFRRRATVFQ
eukprot:1719259-Pyramimonas_sp.AAC.1